MTFPTIIHGHTDRLPTIPDDLNGQDGLLRERNRPNLLQANNDIEAITAWLNSTESDKTRRAYTREIERLLMWAHHITHKPFSSLLRPDYQAYEDFLQHPPEEWCGPRAKRGTPQWRPLTGPMKPDTARHSIIVIQALLQYLVVEGYLAASPLAGKRKREAKRRNNQFALTRAEWNDIWTTIHGLPARTKRQAHRRELLRWTLLLFTHAALRIEEVATHTMANFGTQVIDDQRHWFLFVVGKGNKPEEIPLSQDLLEAMPRFRHAMGWEPDLPIDPAIESLRPLVPAQSGKAIGERAIFTILTGIFRDTADRIKSENPLGAQQLRRASPHTLRHTGITWLGDVANDVKVQSAFARHADIRTTINTYDHRSMQEMIRALRRL